MRLRLIIAALTLLLASRTLAAPPEAQLLVSDMQEGGEVCGTPAPVVHTIISAAFQGLGVRIATGQTNPYILVEGYVLYLPVSGGYCVALT